MNSPATVISIADVTKRFDATVAVDNVSLDLRENEFFALLGPSGCGKTTLLRMIAGFEIPDDGRVMLDGRDMTHLKPNRRPVNLMFQSYALFPHMSVRGNVSYGLEMENIRGNELRRRVDETLDTTQLNDLAERKPDQLSGGQRQRVALARALIKRPRVLLLDEPLGALDRKLREHMKLELKRLQHEVGITFVMVTHDQDEALVMADRIALMNEGRVIQCSTPRDLYEHPETRFAAGFIGEMNMFEGAIEDSGVVCAGLGTISGMAPDNTSGNVVLAVRPERIKVAPSQAALGLDNTYAAEIVEVAYHGQDLSVHLAIGDHRLPAVARVAMAVAESGQLQPGDKVACGWAVEDARILID